MKTTSFIPLIICAVLSCNCKKTDNNQLQVNPLSNINDTVYIKTDSTIILESLYLNLDSIKIGDVFTDKNKNYGYYRLLFSSSEEVQNVYVEKINIVGDGIVELSNRFKLYPQLLRNSSGIVSFEFIDWKTPEVIMAILNKDLTYVNLTTMELSKSIQ